MNKLLLKDVSFKQLLGFAFIMTIGLTIVLLTYALYLDFNQLFSPGKGVFQKEYISINKKVNLFSNLNKKLTYFTEQEMNDLAKQPSVESVAHFTTAAFDITGYISIPGRNGDISTKLFFESIPADYLDVDLTDWTWSMQNKEIAIIIPRSYLTLYNFGFAPSQGLPVVSENMLERIPFTIRIQGQNKEARFNAHIVGLSDRINSILVPQEFMDWANTEYGNSTSEKKITRVLLACKDVTDQKLIAYMKDKQLESSLDVQQGSKMRLYFRLGMLAILAIGILFVGISLFMISLGVSLLLQRSKQNIYNLYSIGIPPRLVERFYQKIVIGLSSLGAIIAFAVVMIGRNYYQHYLHNLVNITFNTSVLSVIWGLLILLITTTLLNLWIVKSKIKECLK